MKAYFSRGPEDSPSEITLITLTQGLRGINPSAVATVGHGETRGQGEKDTKARRNEGLKPRTVWG